jgi:hypothetical protein
MEDQITPEMLTLASIVSIKIQTCLTKFEDEDKKRKRCAERVHKVSPRRRISRSRLSTAGTRRL